MCTLICDICYVSPASSVSAVCCIPQYFKQELFFKQLTGFYFFTSRSKGTALGSKCDKTPIHNNPQYEATAHFMHVRQILTVSCDVIAQLCITYYIVGFPSGKELALLETCNQL